MLFNKIFDFFDIFYDKLVDALPVISVKIPEGFTDGLNSLTEHLGWFFNLGDLLLVFDLWLAYHTLRFMISTRQTGRIINKA